MEPARLRGFPPILDAGVERLILGSFPSAVSLAAGQYYAHPRNQFWPILGRLLGEPLATLPTRSARGGYSPTRWEWGRLWRLRSSGSGDAAIREAAPMRCRGCATGAGAHTVAFNGMAAGRFRPLFDQAGLVTRVLPSTSPAHAGRGLDEKLALWAAWWNTPRGPHAGGGTSGAAVTA
jgi:hypoxanthine-DNA glycosylase